MRNHRLFWVPLCLLVSAAVLFACQPVKRTPALPTRAYSGPPASTRTLTPTSVPATKIVMELAPTEHVPMTPTVEAPAAPVSTTLPTTNSPDDAPTATELSSPSAPADTTPLPPTPSLSPTPTETSSALPLPTETPTPAQEREKLGEIPTAGGTETLYFPAPGDPLEDWRTLMGDAIPPAVQWSSFNGDVESSQPENPARITFRYPSTWVVSGNSTSSRITVQSAQGDRLKLDIIPQQARPTVRSEQQGDFQAHPVQIAGGPAILIVYTQDPGKQQVLSVIFKKNNAWYIAAGQIHLLQSDPAQVDRYRAMLYAMFESIQLAQQ